MHDHRIPHRSRGRLVLYQAYELQKSFLNSASSWAAIGAQLLNNPALPMGYFGSGPIIASALQVFAHLYEERGKPAFNIASVEIDGEARAVAETVVLEKPFCALRHFKREGLPADAPQAADRRADERPLRHAAARHGRAHGREPGGVDHRLGRRQDGPAREGYASTSTTISTT